MKPFTLFLTCANNGEAQKITEELLDNKLVTCVRRFDVKSDYWWKDDIEHADEVQLIMESEEDKYDEIEKTVRQLHSYETFVLMAYPVSRSSKGVEGWLKDSLA